MKHKSNKSRRKPPVKHSAVQKIICIKTGTIRYPLSDGSIAEQHGTACPIELYETYTTRGAVVTQNGDLCYPINEFGGEEMLAQRFVVYDGNSISKPKA